ncbi:hypothetical protein [Xylanimonas sp. McL0601]|uniref:hypothetical protein n=1 Tax=Xylanimonas sp. McL0601 TaxID=3414739 RepID=UPI003CF50BD7
MSTQPGRDAWRDAGVDEPDLRERQVRAIDPDDAGDPDNTGNLLEEALGRVSVPANQATAEEYEPASARPDLDGTADEADVAEQADEVRGLDEEDAYADEPAEPEGPDEDVED